MASEVENPKTPDPTDRPSPTAGSEESRAALPQIPGYEIVEEIGIGATGVVYKARQVSLDRFIAMKVLSPHLARLDWVASRFMREARHAARFDHPGIVRVYDVGHEGPWYYFTMQLVAGENLRDRIRRVGKIPVAETITIAADIVRALDHALKRNIIHRDIKPANILLPLDGPALLADLGLAHDLADQIDSDGRVSIGTPSYTSPEQALTPATVDFRTDIYSLGTTMYHMLTGHPPFSGRTTVEIALKQVEEQAVPVDKVEPLVPPRLAAIVQRMMSKDPAARHGGYDELLADLTSALTHRDFVPEPVLRHRRRRRLAALKRGGVFAALVLAVAAGWTTYGHWKGPLQKTWNEATRQFALFVRPPPPPQPEPKPAPEPEPEEPPDPAQVAFTDAQSRFEKGPRDYASAIACFGPVTRKFPFSAWGTRATDMIDKAKRDLLQRAAADRQAALKRSEPLVQSRRFFEASRVVDTAARPYRGTPAEKSFQSELDRIYREAETLFRNADSQARQLEQAGRLDEAVKQYEQVVSGTFPQFAQSASGRIEQLKKTLAERARAAEEAKRLAARKRGETAFQEACADAAKAVRSFSYRAAHDTVLEKSKQVGEPYAAWLGTLAEVLAANEELQKRMLDRLNSEDKLPIDSFYPKLSGTVTEANEVRITATSAGATFAVKWSELRPAEVLALAGKCIKANDGNDELLLASFCVIRKLDTDARKHMDQAIRYNPSLTNTTRRLADLMLRL